MARLLGVLLLTVIAFIVAGYYWNRTTRFECTDAGFAAAQVEFAELAERRPRRAAEELRKLSSRTRAGADMSLEELFAAWTAPEGEPDPRVCQRLRESLARLR